ncbi:transcriptional regulator [Paraburkholderia sp. J94]|uniref:anti-sigma factor family protein n=1 Tax=Paraburkholderia sp. J94 TaxID=2805441 RepID=UPI002AB008F1|nr:transcriptional regulator [Paraburkholderia sp. J94]
MISQGPPDERPVSEADIQAYTDGSLAGEHAARVRRYLARRPGEWHRILFYRRLNAQMRRSFQAGDASPQAAPDAAHGVSARRARFRLPGVWRRRAAALALLCAMLAAGAAWLALTEPDEHALNNAAVMALMEAAPAAPAASLGAADAAGFAGSLNVGEVRAVPFDLASAGLRLVSAGTMELGPFARAARYVYENGDGAPVVLLGARAWFAADEPQWSARRVGALRLLGWTSHGTRWVLAGNAATHGLMRAADIATQQQGGGAREPRRTHE